MEAEGMPYSRNTPFIEIKNQAVPYEITRRLPVTLLRLISVRNFWYSRYFWYSYL